MNCFWAWALPLSLVWLGLFACMPETVGVIRRDGQHASAGALFLATDPTALPALLGNRRFLGASLALGLMSLPLIAWIGLAPLLLIQLLGLTPLEYGAVADPDFLSGHHRQSDS